MNKKQAYSAPEAETFVVQTEGQLCIVSPNKTLYTEFLIEGGYEEL